MKRGTTSDTERDKQLRAVIAKYMILADIPTRRQLAEECGIPKSTLAYYWQHPTELRIGTLRRLRERLDIPAEEFGQSI